MRDRASVQQAPEGGGHGGGAGGLDAAPGHAGVLGLNHNADTFGFQLGWNWALQPLTTQCPPSSGTG